MTVVAFFLGISMLSSCRPDKNIEPAHKITIRMLFPWGNEDDLNDEADIDSIFKGSPFHKKLIDVMKFASEDLNIDFMVKLLPIGQTGQMKKIASIIKTDHPGAFIFINHFPSSIITSELCESYKVPFFIINTNSVKTSMGTPRHGFRYWIGELVPDDVLGGYELAKQLIGRARQIKNKQKITLVGLAGTSADNASIDRLKGLQQAVAEDRNAELLQFFTSNYEPHDARNKFFYIKKSRYPHVDVLWCAADVLAVAAAKEARQLDISGGDTVLFGGFDWSMDALNEIDTGNMTLSMGGHLLDGAFALVLVYDYLNGKDFADIKTQFKTRLLAATKNNSLQIFKTLSESNLKKIDFKIYSRVYNNRLAKYDFSYERIIRVDKNPD